ncbi:MAG TPA: hypothetical protein VNW90_03645 [Acetobacteraceae bacterium]|jgi:hypothetical protein|nr:hypothetical protein [Acetobacteraceae bacterium]
MIAWFADIRTDIAALRASWGSVRGGWRAARKDAAQLIAHRRIMVDTQAMLPDGMRVVLRTRVRLNGDTETDILRPWLNATTSDSVAALASTHFLAVAAATGGLAAAVAMERLATRFMVAAGTAGGAGTTIWTVLTTKLALLIPTLLTMWALLVPVALAMAGVVVKLILRRRLRGMFRRGLSAPPVRS